MVNNSPQNTSISSSFLSLSDAVSIPVMATGRIVDKRTVNAAFASVAEGVYLGTRFIASKESPASEVT
ncbi:nitronate monooxygenase [Paenibacillus sp. IITD108]|uniref:nitronate monooxygenase n=1 Tax=Paenibacillus sp. IITD108 TaxID=3116649 RepID=UPI002F3F715F